MNTEPTLPAPRDPELEAMAAAWRAAESAIAIAMVTSAIPGLSVTYLEGDSDEAPEV